MRRPLLGMVCHERRTTAVSNRASIIGYHSHVSCRQFRNTLDCEYGLAVAGLQEKTWVSTVLLTWTSQHDVALYAQAPWV